MPASKMLLKIQSDTKLEEKEIIEQFLMRLQYTAISLTCSECPDFELKINERLIGIEITKYYSGFTKKGSIMQQKINEWKKFAVILKEKLLNIEPNYVYLYGAIHFHRDTINYKELFKDECFDEMVKIIKNTNPPPNKQKSINVSSDNFPFLSRHIESLSLWNIYPETKYLWWDSRLQSGYVLDHDSAIQEIVYKKERKSKKYKCSYFQKWLIIYAGGVSFHDMFSECDPLRQGTVSLVPTKDSQEKSSFDVKSDYFTHIFIWDKFTESIFQLLPYYKKIFDYGEKKIWVNHLPLHE